MRRCPALSQRRRKLNKMKIFTGKVIGLQAKTATVSVERIKIHPIYQKRFKRSTKYHVQDETGVKIGDMVKFSDTRPYSKTKKWKILQVVGDKKEAKK
ncbi:MAG: 30S ribosomal protein S17 [Candidatus Woesebacteria bacterium GW2011_GWD1_41_12]|uniref:Small ribosomal subunit protein uS17 n=7 Tax=Candidatus Woeseibacteriota TaxID=1752722 RepID=A0A0G0WW91_9BACT|nr:MAG: 30S ribosomal protein S17 [Candidatus Woesebacteria bacterium GW2011_GWD1_41_12]KKS17004.1 MAG: 30S ribosomal protein S17 [Candidatus Woesebacteria bacterium GW2011_GWA1_41_7]